MPKRMAFHSTALANAGMSVLEKKDESGRCGATSHAILILGSTLRSKPANLECLVSKVDGKLAIEPIGAELS